jgi:hypothetical protein
MPSSHIALELFDQTQVCIGWLKYFRKSSKNSFSSLFFSFLFWVVVIWALKIYCPRLLEIGFFLGFVISPCQCQLKQTHPFDLKLSDQTPLLLDTIEKALL